MSRRSRSLAAQEAGTAADTLVEVAVDAVLLVALLQRLDLGLADGLQVRVEGGSGALRGPVVEGHFDEPKWAEEYLWSSSISKMVLFWYLASKVLRCVLAVCCGLLVCLLNCFLPVFSDNGGLRLMRMASSSSLGWLLCTRPPTNLQDLSPFHRGSDYLSDACVDRFCMLRFNKYKANLVQLHYRTAGGMEVTR